MNAIASHRIGPPLATWLGQMTMLAPAFSRLLQAGNLTELSDLVMQELGNAQAGINAWQVHPYRHGYGNRKQVWQSGNTRIFSYHNGRGGVPVLVIPSLINNTEILDLREGNSFISALYTRGLWPFLLDWQVPGPAESGFSTADYITKRLLPALAFLRQYTGGNPALIGHCVGGTLAVATAQLDKEVAGLITLGAPWEFPRREGPVGVLQAADPTGIKTMLDAIASPDATLPGGFFQFLFALFNPGQLQRRFAEFAKLPPNSTKATHFVAIQDWLSTGPPVALPAAKEMLVDWHLSNQIQNGSWQVEGIAIDANVIPTPTLCICGKYDSVTPSDSALPLGHSIPKAQVLTPDAGHISMIVGPQALVQSAAPIAQFINEIT